MSLFLPPYTTPHIGIIFLMEVEGTHMTTVHMITVTCPPECNECCMPGRLIARDAFKEVFSYAYGKSGHKV